MQCAVFFDGCNSQGACGLHNAAGVNEDVFDGCTDFVGINAHEVVDQIATDAKGFFANEFDGGAVREKTHVAKTHSLTGLDRLHHGIGIVHLNANDPNIGTNGFEVIGNPRNEASSSNGDKNSV